MLNPLPTLHHAGDTLHNLLLGEREHRSVLANAHSAELLANSDSLVDALARNESAEDTTSKRVTRAVRVNNILHLLHTVRLGLLLPLGSHNGRLRPMRNNDGTLVARLVLGVGNVLRNGREVRGVGELVCLCVGLGLGFVAEDEGGEGEDLVELGGEELGNEGGRDVD